MSEPYWNGKDPETPLQEIVSLRKQLALANARCARLAEKHRGDVKALKARIAELEVKV